MPLDHYVSQVHLKNFYSPKLKNLMYAIRKSDLKFFTPNAQSVCRINDGSTNSYLALDRAVEELLKKIEPKYNATLEKLSADNIDAECIYTIAGFVAYVLTCSPAGIRINSTPLKSIVEESGRLMDSKNLFPVPPPELGGVNPTDLLDSGKVSVKIDSKYAQALGIDSIQSCIKKFGNRTWDILLNPFDDSPFFTSDFPVAIEKTKDPRVFNGVVPLSPKLAIRIRPDPSLERDHLDFSFSRFSHRVRKLGRSDVVKINRLIVRCAEDEVYFRDDYEWIRKFVKRNALFRIERRTRRIRWDGGSLMLFAPEVVETG